MTDIHCHILPGVDDGSKSWEMTVAMCQIAQADGIRHIVATPHANHNYPYRREEHADRVEELRVRVPGIDFSLGCDFNLSHDNIVDAVRHPDRYSIGNSQYILVEFNDFQIPRQMTESLSRLHSAGFITIVSHPERNPIVHQYPDMPQQFVDMGSLIQITAGALCGEWGRKARKSCEVLLRKGLVSFIATDAHDPKLRKPLLSSARKAAAKIIGSNLVDRLVLENPFSIVSNQASANLPLQL
jgi:protein-tyrosine phosphatase